MGLRGWLFKETLLSYVSGAVFAAGWWIWIDACVYSAVTNDPKKIYAQYYIPGIVSTVAVLMINALSWAQINGTDNGFWAEGTNTKAKIWFFASFTIAFGALIAAGWIGIQRWLVDDQGNNYPGIALILQNALIFLAMTLLRVLPRAAFSAQVLTVVVHSALIYRFAKPQIDEFGEPLLANS